MNFLPSAQRERHTFVDNTIAQMRDFAGNAAVRQVLGEDLLGTFNHMASNYCVPNKRGNTFYPTKSQIAARMFPIIAVGHDDKFRRSPNFAYLGERQITNLTRYMTSQVGINSQDAQNILLSLELFSRKLAKSDRLKTSLEDQDASALVINTPFETNKFGDRYDHVVLSQPVMVLDKTDVVDPLTLWHEMVHVWQSIRAPAVYLPDIPNAHDWHDLAEEREAYRLPELLIETGQVAPSIDEYNVFGRALGVYAVAAIDQVFDTYPGDGSVSPIEIFGAIMTRHRDRLRRLSGPTKNH